MVYFVRHGDRQSKVFKAFIGLLTGDPASPILWNLFPADLVMMPDKDDVFLATVRISILAQADDILFFSISARGLQSSCARNFILVHLVKTIILIFEKIALPLPVFMLGAMTLEIILEEKYVGVTFHCVPTPCRQRVCLGCALCALTWPLALCADFETVRIFSAMSGRLSMSCVMFRSLNIKIRNIANLESGIEVLGGRILLVNINHRIRSIIRKAMILMLPATRRIGRDALPVLRRLGVGVPRDRTLHCELGRVSVAGCKGIVTRLGSAVL
ncbi:hypothetical protein B0H19DRAFT_924354 [Mycena capillaripes]|nr:hypothetical protein B0H19DRAFT_924354 [Mycena capillaripes]